MPEKIRLAIDLVPMVGGRSGTGGGVWTYCVGLLKGLNELNDPRFELMCFCNSNHKFVNELKNIKLIHVSLTPKSILTRLFWIHVYLPILCLKHRIGLLHKLATEVPFFHHSKLVTTVHDFMTEYYQAQLEFGRSSSISEKLKKWYFKAITNRACSKSDIIITPTQSVADEAIKLYKVRPGKIKVTYEGVTPMKNRHTKNIKDTNKTILYIAAFHLHKGHQYAIHAFNSLLENEKSLQGQCTLQLRGHIANQAHYDMILALIKESPFSKNIAIEQYSVNATLEEIYNQGDLVLLLSSYEGFGLPLIEATTFGIPVVCSNIPVFREVLEDSAFYCNPKNTTEVAQTLAEIIISNKRKERINEALLLRYTWLQTAKRTVEAYHATTTN